MLGQLAPRFVGAACPSGQIPTEVGCIDATASVNLGSPQAVAATQKTLQDVQVAGSAAGASAQAAYSQLQANTAAAGQGLLQLKDTAVAKANAVIGGMTAEEQQVWAKATNFAAQTQAYNYAVSAAQQLAANPDIIKAMAHDPKAQAEIVAVVAGACAATGVLAPLGAIISVGWLLKTAVQGLLEAIGIIGKPGYHCTSKGFTTEEIFGYFGAKDVSPGSFRSVAVPVFVKAYADAMSCKVPSLMVYPYATLAAIAKIWNNAADGAMVDYYIPHLVPDAADWIWINSMNDPTFTNGLAEQEIYGAGHGLGPGVGGGIFDPLAFRPLTEVLMRPDGDFSVLRNEYFGVQIQSNPFQGPTSPSSNVDLLSKMEGKGWSRLRLKSGPLRKPLLTTVLDAAKVAVPLAAAGTFGYAWYTGKSVETVLRGVWRYSVSLFR